MTIYRNVGSTHAHGYPHRAIAEALVLAERTVEVHARNIREKLGFHTRAQIAAWAIEQGLLTPRA